jgi:hypothetical protein
MDLTEIKSGNGHKRNRIVLKDLSKRRKEVLMSGGVVAAGISIGAGAFSLYSMNEPDTIPEASLNFIETSGAIETTVGEPDDNYSEEIAIYSDKPISNMDQLDISFGEAFKVAREEVGPGGWFIWKEKVFNTYYKEEWENLSSEDRIEYLASLKAEDVGADDIQNEAAVFATTEVIPDEKNYGEVIQPHNELHEVPQESTEAADSGSLANAVFMTESDDNTQIKVDNSPMEFELPEDSVIFEIPAEDFDSIESVVFDAAENDIFINERSNEKFESISPIELKNLSGDLVSSENVGLVQNKTNEVEEYPWGEPIIKVDHDFNKSGSAVTINQESNLVNSTSNSTEEITEYPWGESISKIGNVSFAHDIEVINDVELNSVNTNELSNQPNPVEEYPWGEQVNQVDETNTSQIDQSIDFNDSPIFDISPLENENDFDIDFDK